MTISTTSVKPRTYTSEERRLFVSELRKFHQPYFDSIGEPRARFMGKVKYSYPPTEKMKCYLSELIEDRPFYVEWVSRDYVPEDKRRLYKYKFNPNFEEEYPQINMGNSLHMYEVPTDRFELVKAGEGESPLGQQVTPQTVMDFDLDLPISEDCPVSQMTLRDVASLILKAPISRKEWLNELIKHATK
jgi:hypothetical protein